ncbi:hypothetical protein ABH15_04925 [Methanoculleus taiwanensis]|uniref:Uncharacterized protein n=1 Tax=Methanoculleus taiwanensis TaxID=1550565 RepID=A0A498H170_9EURY|nr:hypothetical protein ABH15_04925 [Methanoculleus taiwanensis]
MPETCRTDLGDREAKRHSIGRIPGRTDLRGQDLPLFRQGDVSANPPGNERRFGEEAPEIIYREIV